MDICLLLCCVLSGRGLCDELITRPEESYRLWRVVCDHETSWYEEAIALAGLYIHRNKRCLQLQMAWIKRNCFLSHPVPQTVALTF
jgi:hypothetical protein